MCKYFVLFFVVVLNLASMPTIGATDPHVIKIDGSSTVFPITEAVSEEFQKEQKGAVQVTVGISGTGGGFKKFCRGETDVQDASRPISKEEMKLCKDNNIQYVELPIAYDALTVVVSPQNTWVSEIAIEELKKIWEPGAQGKITQWNQIRPSFPNESIKLFGAGSDSGTFDYFTEAVVGKAKSSRGDYTSSEDDNTLVIGVSKNKYALGYLPFAYYEPNKRKLKALSIKGDQKKAVFPSAETVQNGTYSPLSRPLFIYVNPTSAKNPKVKSFVEFYLKNTPTLAREVKYVPLPSKAYTLALANFKRNKVGTAFGGEAQIGLKIEDLLKRATKN